MTAIGEYRHTVTLLNPGLPVPDGDGGYTETWVTIGMTPAKIVGASSSDLERLTSNAVVISTTTHVVTIRYRPGITTKTRLRFRDRTFSVTGIANLHERDVELTLSCVEVVT